jgi:hypothetical protein
MPSLSDALKNASISELEVICRRITPFVAGKNPPQIMTIAIDDSTLLDILKKYNIISSSTYPFQTLSKSYGTVKVIEYPITDPQTGKTEIKNVIYIEPPSLETLKQENKDTSIDIAPSISSGFDGITALLDKKITEEYTKKLDETINAGWNTKAIIPQVTKNESDGSEKITLMELDPEETNRIRLLKGPGAPAQYKIFTPDVPPVVPVNLNENSLEVAELVTGASVEQQRTAGTSLSPMSEASSAYSTLTSDFYRGLKTFSGLNAVAIKSLNALGVFNFEDFNKNVGNTWGGFSHVGKNYLVGLRANINNATAAYWGVTAIIDFFNGDYEEGKKHAEKSFEWLYKEYVFVPRYQSIADALGRAATSVIPYDESYTPKGYGTQGRGKIILSESDKSLIRKWFPKSKTPTINGALTKDQSIIASVEIGRAKGAERTMQRTSGIIQAAGYVNLYVVKPLIEDDVKKREDDRKKFDDQQIQKQIADQISTQPKITRQSGNTITYDNGEILAKDPRNGNIVPVKIPLISDLKTVNNSSEIDWNWIINQSLPPNQRTGYKTDLPVIDVYGDKYGNFEKAWDGAKDFMYNSAIVTKDVVEKTPLNFLVADAIGVISKTPQFVGNLFGKKFPQLGESLINKVTEILTTGEWAIGKNIKVPVGTIITGVTIFLTEPVEIGDSTMTGYYTRALEGLRQKLKEGIKDPKERQDVIDKIRDYEEALNSAKEIENQIEENKKLHSPEKDPDLSSNVNLLGEVESAKQDYNRLKSIVDDLTRIGRQISNGSSPVPPIPLSNINQNVNFVPNADFEINPPWKNYDPNLNIPIRIESCFPEYVMITTETGNKKISELKINDSVISFNSEGFLERDIVSDVFKHENREVYRYFLENGSHIDITKEHPVLVDLNKFEKIGNLNVGHSLIDINNNKLKIIDIKFLQISDVFNIEVEKNNTYIAENIRVHNKLGQSYQRRLEKENALEIFSILGEYETSQQEYLNWVNEQFENAVRLTAANYSPYLVPYDYVPGTPRPKRITLPTPSGTPTTNPSPIIPYGGPPIIDNSATDSYYDSPINSIDYVPLSEMFKP